MKLLFQSKSGVFIRVHVDLLNRHVVVVQPTDEANSFDVVDFEYSIFEIQIGNNTYTMEKGRFERKGNDNE